MLVVSHPLLAKGLEEDAYPESREVFELNLPIYSVKRII